MPNKYRSRAEEYCAAQLKKMGVKFEFEKIKKPYTSTITNGICLKCQGPAVQKRIYLLDFWIPDLSFGIEVKGRLDSPTRKKMRDVKKDSPEFDVRFLFMADNKLNKNRPERYSDWANKNGFKWAVKILPPEWFGLNKV